MKNSNGLNHFALSRLRSVFAAAGLSVAGIAIADIAIAHAATPLPAAIERGKDIFTASGCYGCHTDKDGPALAGGGPLATPFGTFYAPNITPDREHGIGRWSEADFIRALREGVSPDGQQYFPVFPYTSFTRMTTQDMRDLWAYLQTLPASDKANRSHQISFPFSIRLTLIPWKWLFFNRDEFRADPNHDASWNRGAYLVQALTHCGECHTPRNWFGAVESQFWLSGARMPVGDLVAPNLTPDRTGLIDWSAADIQEFLKSGEYPQGGTASGEMREVIDNSTSRISENDRKTIATYLKSLPATRSQVKPKIK